MRNMLILLLGMLLCGSCSQESALAISAAEETVAPGEQICVDVTANGFQDILTMQFSIGWDDEVLRFVDVQNFGIDAMTAQNFGRPPSHPDRLTVAWFEPNLKAVSVPDNTVLFSVCFEAVGAPGTSSEVMLTDEPTIIEIANKEEEVLEPEMVNGKVEVE